jgi:hypothetical protein
MHVPARPLRGRWPRWLERRLSRFFWDDPTVVLDPKATPEGFRVAMNAIHVGGTIKITGVGRHPRSDGLLIDNVDLSGKHLLDIGASDGSTSADLISRLPDFGQYTIADLHLYIGHRATARHDVLYDGSGEPILIVGRRVVAWPSLSRPIRLLYLGVLRRAEQTGQAPTPVLLLNPVARRLVEEDPRVEACEHNVFSPWTGKPVDAIKVANLLRRLYFSDAQISNALEALIENLPDGGHLLVVDNPRVEGVAERGGLYRREGGRFLVVAETSDRPEIADLVEGVRVDPVPHADRGEQ